MSHFVIRRVLSEADWADVVRIRTCVFIEEQACPSEEEWDEYDTPDARFTICRHFLGELDGIAVAAARWHPYKYDGVAIAKLERFAVLEEARGHGFGKTMIKHLAGNAREAGFNRQILHAQAYLEDLYANLGFSRVGGVFVEAGIPHVKMISTGEQ